MLLIVFDDDDALTRKEAIRFYDALRQFKHAFVLQEQGTNSFLASTFLCIYPWVFSV